jgi:hypothetical protein
VLLGEPALDWRAADQDPGDRNPHITAIMTREVLAKLFIMSSFKVEIATPPASPAPQTRVAASQAGAARGR